MPRSVPQAAVAFDDGPEPAATDAPTLEVPAADPAQATPNYKEDPDSDAGLIAKFEGMIEVPPHLEKWYRRFQEDRDYVNDLCMLLDDTDTVATNYILRNQYVLMSQLHNANPDLSISPRDLLKLPPPPPIMVPGPTGMPMPIPAPPTPPAPGMLVAPTAAPGPDQETQSLALFGATAERVIKHYLDQASARKMFDGVLQDTFTCGIAWLKVSYQEDYARDALGNVRQDDQQIKFAQYRYLRELFDANLIDENCPEYKEMIDVNNTIKAYLTGQIEDDLKMNPPAAGPMQFEDGSPAMGTDGGMMMQPTDPRISHLESLSQDNWVPLAEVPDVGRYRGFVLEQVMPEDIRHDWNVIRPEEIHISGEWMAQRVFMTREQFGRKFQITPDEMKQPLAYDGAGNPVGQDRRSPKGNKGSEDPADRSDLETTKQGDRVAVWEFQNKKTGRVYVWARGMKRFVRNYVPTVRPKNFFTVFPFYFNRVTGRSLPLSDVRLQMSQQDEINLLRTHEREARRACYPKIIVGKGLFAKGEKAKLENALPYAVIEMNRASDIAKSLHEVQPPTIHAELYDVSKAIRELEIMAGIPQSAMGTMAGADSATEAAISNERMGEQADRRRALFEAFIHDIAWCIGEMAIEIIDPDTALQIAGQGGFWPLIDRQKLFNMLQLNIRAGSTGKPDSKKVLDLIQQVVQLATMVGQQTRIDLKGLLEETIKVSGVYLDLAKILPPIPPMMPGMPPPMPGMPGAPPGAPPAPPAGPTPTGQEGPGAPPMMTPRPPEKIPGSPAAALAKSGPP